MRPEMERFRETFHAEAAELCAAMEGGLLALEGSFDPDALGQVFRALHTLKGNASMMGFAAAARLAHAAEELLEKLAEDAQPVTPELSTLLLESVDALRLRIGIGREDGRPIDVDADDIERRLLEAATAAAVIEPPPSVGRDPVAPERPAEGARREQERTLRVELDRLDKMLDLMGEIAIARGRLATMLAEADKHSPEALLAAHRGADSLHLGLQELLMKARMVPIGRAFRPFARTLHDLCAATGKLVRLETSGDDVEVDASIIDHIRDPLTHLVRNAVDHGIEPPDVRRARGKPPSGLLSLRASREAGNIVVQVADDGAGLDRERIQAHAEEAGLLPEGEEISDEALFGLVFQPGFSTASRVSELSGRGIGMDVVKRNIEAVRGHISLETTAGAGTRISLRLPLSLSILEGFSVGVGPDTYVFPLENVIECVELPESERDHQGAGVINLRGRPLPYLRLRDVFAVNWARPARESVVVIEHAGGRAGIAVDALLGQGQTVIKPLGRLFQRVPGISGSAILGSGRVALILDVAALLHKALGTLARAAVQAHPPGTTT
ncbi:chemotaxis protein CheA [Polyangium aurulentum]|uniref:chemotaxis protein CheA n=1 Tax=Polyangium aurulentum TaxID=2567896 RepID=UPI0010AE0FA9|nr:chemotaxis protein CheA [Polyangium aurulentum]UQA56707.1 chemotaxis protein CheA [Polyangium aurulentum]